MTVTKVYEIGEVNMPRNEKGWPTQRRNCVRYGKMVITGETCNKEGNIDYNSDANVV